MSSGFWLSLVNREPLEETGNLEENEVRVPFFQSPPSWLPLAGSVSQQMITCAMLDKSLCHV